MRTYKRISKIMLNKLDFMSWQDFVNAIDDICGDCVKKDCAWHKVITSYVVWRKSHNFFSLDCFKGEEKENGKNKRNGKNRESEKLDYNYLPFGD